MLAILFKVFICGSGKRVFIKFISKMATPPKYDPNVSFSSMKQATRFHPPLQRSLAELQKDGVRYWKLKQTMLNPFETSMSILRHQYLADRLIGKEIYYFNAMQDTDMGYKFGKGVWLFCRIQDKIEVTDGRYLQQLTTIGDDSGTNRVDIYVDLLLARESWFFYPAPVDDPTLEGQCHRIMDWDCFDDVIELSSSSDDDESEPLSEFRRAEKAKRKKQRRDLSSSFKYQRALCKRALEPGKRELDAGTASPRPLSRQRMHLISEEPAAPTSESLRTSTRVFPGFVLLRPSSSSSEADSDTEKQAGVKITLRKASYGSLTVLSESDAHDSDTELNIADVIADAAAEDAAAALAIEDSTEETAAAPAVVTEEHAAAPAIEDSSQEPAAAPAVISGEPAAAPAIEDSTQQPAAAAPAVISEEHAAALEQVKVAQTSYRAARAALQAANKVFHQSSHYAASAQKASRDKVDNEDLFANAEQATSASTAAGAKVKAALEVSATAKKALRDAQRALSDVRSAAFGSSCC